MLKKLIKFFQALNKNANPNEIAHAVCLGMMLGFMPKGNLLWFALTIAWIFLRINKGALVIFTFLFSLLAPVLDPFFDNFGYAILTLSFMEPVFTAILNVPLLGFTKINNTIICGSLFTSLILYIPIFFLSKLFIKVWRNTLAGKIRKTKLMKFLKKLPLVKKIGDLA